MPSQRVRYAMAHLSHEQHISLLARPNWRRIQRTDMNILPDPYTTSRAALRSRASKRIKIMARPKFVNRKYDPSLAMPVYSRVHPKTLKAQASKRIHDLAMPKRRTLLASLRFVSVNQKVKGNVEEQLSRLKSSRYQKYRIFCNAVWERDMRSKKQLMQKLKKALKTRDDWERHRQALERLAAPKKIQKPKRGKKKRWRPVHMRRIKRLARPVNREEPMAKDPFGVDPSALTYKISKRVRKLAERKNPPVIITPRVPGAVSPAAKNAVASSWIVRLAKPAERPPGVETDLKENAFTVSPTALKAKCSRRLKILAKPKAYVTSYTK